MRKPKVELAWNAACKFEDALNDARDELREDDIVAFERLLNGVFRGMRARLEAVEGQG